MVLDFGVLVCALDADLLFIATNKVGDNLDLVLWIEGNETSDEGLVAIVIHESTFGNWALCFCFVHKESWSCHVNYLRNLGWSIVETNFVLVIQLGKLAIAGSYWAVFGLVAVILGKVQLYESLVILILADEADLSLEALSDVGESTQGERR